MKTTEMNLGATIALTDDELSAINGGLWGYVGAFLAGLAVNYAYDKMGGADGIDSGLSSLADGLLSTAESLGSASLQPDYTQR